MRLLCLVKRDLYDRCFPPPLCRDLESAAAVEWLDAGALSDAEYSARLRQYDVLLGGWGARGLPAGYAPLVGSSGVSSRAR